jgi:hypothetical protein
VAAIAFSIAALATSKWFGQRAFLALSLAMVLFFQAARLAMASFDPYLSSRPLAEAILKSPPGTLIVDHHYYTFSSIFFYTNRTAFLRNGRFNNLEYGAYAPGAPDVFLDDRQFRDIWLGPQRCYLVASQKVVPTLESLVGGEHLNVLAASGGKVVLTNRAVSQSQSRKLLRRANPALVASFKGNRQVFQSPLSFQQIDGKETV